MLGNRGVAVEDGEGAVVHDGDVIGRVGGVGEGMLLRRIDGDGAEAADGEG